MGFENLSSPSAEDQERIARVVDLMLKNSLSYPAAIRKVMNGKGITNEEDILSAIKRLSASTNQALKTVQAERTARQADEEEIRRDLRTLTEEEFDNKYPLV